MDSRWFVPAEAKHKNHQRNRTESMQTKNEEKELQRERELWMIIIGALLTGDQATYAEVFSVIDPYDAHATDIQGILKGIETKNVDGVRAAIQRLANEKAHGGTMIQVVLSKLKDRALRRWMVKAGKRVESAGRIMDGDKFAELLEEQLQWLVPRVRDDDDDGEQNGRPVSDGSGSDAESSDAPLDGET